MDIVEGGITAVPGILAAGMAAGIKKTNLPDLALMVSEREAVLAGVLTRNQVAAAPVITARKRLARGAALAILANSGNANACTGRHGLADAEEMAALVARALDCSPMQVVVGSTGVIGKPLPMERIREAVPVLVSKLSRDGGVEAARAILTTDTTLKMAAVSEQIGGRRVTLGGLAKGSGMIHPDMATMLAYLATDAEISRLVLQRTLQTAVAHSFNRLPLDGDTSTNDMVLCLANRQAGNRPVRLGTPDGRRFQTLMDHVCTDLAKMIARDSEGGTKFVELTVTGARSESTALRVANTIATSSLVKTSWFGEDCNWGRIMAAIGRAGIPIDEKKTSISYGEVQVVRKGIGIGPEAEELANKVLKQPEFTVNVDLGVGRGAATVWTSDLTLDYVKINASYRS